MRIWTVWFLICFRAILEAKIRIFSLQPHSPELMELQERMFRRFLLDEHELIFVETRPEPLIHDDLEVFVDGDFFPIRPVSLRRWVPFRLEGLRNSSELRPLPSSALRAFGFNEWELKLIKALPSECNVEFYLDNHFLRLSDTPGDETGTKVKLKYIQACLRNTSCSHYDQTVNLKKICEYYASLPPTECDIGEHLPRLAALASECSTVTEIGLGNVLVSTWGILQGLSQNQSPNRSYLGIDIIHPQSTSLNIAEEEARKRQIAFRFIEQDDLKLAFEPVELLFIDSMHTYCHLTYELETFSPKVTKYIALHDTSHSWEFTDDGGYVGDYSEYPKSYSRQKKGLWSAVLDFVENHPEWVIQERRENCNGFTILRRVHD